MGRSSQKLGLNSKVKSKPKLRHAQKATALGKPASSHSKLNGEFVELGRVVARAKPGKKSILDIADPTDHRGDIMQRFLKNAKSSSKRGGVKSVFSSTRFDDQYRDSWKAQDELVSTSAVRQMVLGVLDVDSKSPLSAAAAEHINDIVNNVSRVRLPTKYSGFATANEVMQHPTASNTGVFAESAHTAAAHAKYDTERKAVIARSMKAASKIPHASSRDVVKAGVLAAIEYTLSDFTAPATANDVRPFTRMGKNGGKAGKDELEQVEMRELLKKIYVGLGGVQESPTPSQGGRSRARGWEGRRGRGLRSVSPPRDQP